MITLTQFSLVIDAFGCEAIKHDFCHVITAGLYTPRSSCRPTVGGDAYCTLSQPITILPHKKLPHQALHKHVLANVSQE